MLITAVPLSGFVGLKLPDWNIPQGIKSVISAVTDGFSSLAARVSAASTVASGTCGDNLTWVLDSNGLLTISGTGEMRFAGNIPWYTYRNRIRKVVINYGATNIGSGAFSSCGYLTDIVIPNSVTSIGASAFYACENLSSVTIPNSVTSIESFAFSSCYSIANIIIPNSVTSIDEWTFTSCDSLTSVTIGSGVKDIGESAFSGCESLANITIENSIANIDESAFSGCDNLTSITIGNCMTYIDFSCFNFFTTLKEIRVSEDHSYFFSYDGVLFNKEMTKIIKCPYSKVKDYIIPNTVTCIGNEAFSGCSSLTNITIPNSVAYISNYAFSGCSSLINATIPNHITNIPSGAFMSCSSLTSVTIPDSVTRISDRAFSGCSSLTSVNIPSSVTNIDSSTFLGCSSLTSVNIPSSVTNINSSAFAGCSSLTSVNIPNSVTRIGESAFYKCSSLTSITIPGSVTRIDNFILNNCTNLKNIIVSSNNNNYCSIEGVLFNKEVTQLIEYPIGKSDSAYAIPESITCISSHAFDSCTILKSVSFPENIDVIGYAAFSCCSSLSQVYFNGNAPTNFGKNVFSSTASDFTVFVKNPENTTGWTFPTWNGYSTASYTNCNTLGLTLDGTNSANGITYSLNSSTYTASVSAYSGGAVADIPSFVTKANKKYVVTSIGNNAFKNAGITEVNIPSGILSIGSYAFADNTGLTSFNGSQALTSIGAYAFSGCTALKDVKLYNTLTSISEGTFNCCSSLAMFPIGSKVTSIGNSAFEGCKVPSSITFSDNITSIGAKAFYGCTSLEEVKFGSKVSSIGNAAFSSCTRLSSASFTGDAPSSVGTNIFGTTGNTAFLVYFSTDKSGWSSAVSGGKWRGYYVAPYNAISDFHTDDSSSKAYVLSVIDENGKAVANSSVTLDNVTKATDENGLAYFVRPSASQVILKVEKQGFNTYQNQYTISEMPVDYVILNRDPSTIIPIRCNDDNIGVGFAQINRQANLTARIEVKGNSQFPITKYELVQDNKIIETSIDGIFNVDNYKFSENTAVYVFMYTADGNNVQKKLNINVVSFSSRFIPNLDTYENKIVIPNSVQVIGGTEIDLSGLGKANTRPTSFEVTNYSLKVGFGIKVLGKSSKEIEKESINYFKNTLKEFKTTTSHSMDFNTRLCGYFTLNFGPNGVDSANCSLALLYKFEFNASVTYTFIVPLRLEFEFETSGKFEVKLTAKLSENGIGIALDTNMIFKITLRVGFGITAFSFGAYGDLRMDVSIKDSKAKELRLNGNVGIYAKGGIIFKWKKEKALWPYLDKVFPLDNKSSAKDGLSFDEAVADMLSNDDNYEIIGREYLDKRSGWLPPTPDGDSADGSSVSSTSTLLQSSTYSYINPQIVSCGDTTMMFYLDDDGGNDNNNFQTLVYSVYKNGEWSEPAKVDGNTLVDNECSVCSDNERYIYITYSQANREMTPDDTEMSDYVSVMETVATRYDTQTGRFEQQILTDNDTYDFMQTVSVVNGTPTILWVNNSSNQPFAENADNTLVVSCYTDGAWSKPKELLSGSNSITCVDAGILNGSAYTAVVVDSDSDMSTLNNNNIYLISSDGTVTLLTKTPGDYANVQFAEFDGVEQLVWYSNGNLSYVTDVNSEVSHIFTDAPQNLSNNYYILENNGRYDILFTAANESDFSAEGKFISASRDIYGVFYENGVWGNSVRITDCGDNKYVNFFSAAYTGDRLLMPYLVADVNFNEDSFNEVCSFYTSLTKFGTDLTMGKVSFDIYDLTDDDSLTLTVPVTNNSTKKVSGVNVVITDSSEKNLYSCTNDAVIKSGETLELNVTFTLPESFSTGKYAVSVTPIGDHDDNESDDFSLFSLGYSDFSVSAEQKILGKENYILASVTNNGTVSSDGKLTVKKGDSSGKELYSANIDTLAPGNTAIYQIAIDSSFLNSGSNFSSITVCADSTADELNSSNDYDCISVAIFEEDVADTENLVNNSSISPALTEYDKHSSSTVNVTLELNGNTFSGVTGLIKDIDYTVSGNTVTLTKSYLSKLSEGTHDIEFCFIDTGNSLQKKLLSLEINNSAPKEITGTVRISGVAVYANELTADITALSPHNSQLTYCWQRDEKAIVGATNVKYVLTQEDIGHRIRVLVSGEGEYYGTLTSSTVTVAKAAGNTAFSPCLASRTCFALNIVKYTGYEYRIGAGTWQNTTNFSGLMANTSYRIGIRKAETATSFVGEEKITYFKTEPMIFDVDVKIIGEPARGNVLTAKVTGPGAYTYTLQWYRSGKAIVGATTDKYTVQVEDVGYKLKVVATANGIYSGIVESALVDAYCNHVYENWQTTVPAECMKEGTQSATCVCGEISERTLDALGHAWDNGKLKKAATCTTEGETIYICTRSGCNEEKTEVIPATNHINATNVDAIPASCTYTGFTEGIYCPDCNTWLSGHEKTSATGHKDNDRNGICDNCNANLTAGCSCNCHKNGIAKFFFNFILIFQKLFGQNKLCQCGKAHY